ncbi:MAG TPA: proteasome assembly chaperone family protein [Methanotrichaceae archaeon]|nr:proteasome assembly chaperone family protein [Methanotrichaceae archaeon]HQI92192.1 proteasome assembly chaperone family protein [Methanotrichaceae archaeon]HQJ29347.1 proteasome assembly chaperone family protein [Methanotrichaceae archaeon]
MYHDPVQVILENEPSSQNPLLVEGFPGIGLVGNIASQYMVHELNMTYLGAMTSRFFPPLAVLLGGVVNMPVRIYEKPEINLILLTSDIPIHPLATYDMSKEIVRWASSIKVREIACLAGITLMTEQRRVFGAVTSPEMLDRIKGVAEIFELGTISGISGSLMNECRIKGLSAICLLGETLSDDPDPRSAAAAIDALNKIYGLGVSTEKLLDRASEIELQMHQLAEQVKTQGEETPQKEFPMYG